MLFGLFIVFQFLCFVCGIYLFGGFVGWLINKYNEHKLNQGIESFSSSFMTDEEIEEWMKSLRK